ncbi:MAG: DUF2284 domain-containing protein [Nanoarchaeota archaeon]|nr:DUF2284 domain-containing protein [Nanoarchaeota archaeon]
MIVKIRSDIVSFGEYVQNFCKNKYPQHSSGCPNYGKKNGCPPCELIDSVLDFEKDIYLIYTEFNIGEFAQKMRVRFPGWSERQCFNSRLWQGKARKEHNLELERFREKFHLDIVLQPERKGVDINLLFIRLGMKLEWPPRKIARVVSLGGTLV